MKAVLVQWDTRNGELAIGDEIEVIGFVYYAAKLWAVWRDDTGHIWDIDTKAIRMSPNTGTLPYVEGSLEVTVQ